MCIMERQTLLKRPSFLVIKIIHNRKKKSSVTFLVPIYHSFAKRSQGNFIFLDFY